MYKHMGKVVIKILQGSAVTQTVLGGLTIDLLVVNLCMCQKLWKLAGSRQSYCNNKQACFLAHPVSHINDFEQTLYRESRSTFFWIMFPELEAHHIEQICLANLILAFLWFERIGAGWSINVRKVTFESRGYTKTAK